MKTILRSCISDYKIPRTVIVRSFTFTLICRSIQLIIIILFCGMMIYEKGYQLPNKSITSFVKFRVKGTNYKPIEKNQRLLIDDADYTVSLLEKDGLFIITNSFQVDQEYTRCSGSFYEKELACVNNSACQLLQGSQYGNVKWTGRCITTTGRCEIEGWCPVMNDHDLPTPSEDTLNFTIFIRNLIENKYFGLARSNIQAHPSYLKVCNYHPISDSLCPIFRIGTLLDIVEPDPDEQRSMLRFGGIIQINIDWICNLDHPYCSPTYSFKRLDTPFTYGVFARGFSIRFASHWKRDNQSFRILTKAYGLRFVVSVNGYFARFNLMILIFYIILLIGTLCLITSIFDIIGLHIYRRSAVDQSQISENVVEESKRKNGDEV